VVTETSARALEGAVRAWLDGLDAAQRDRATFAFDDPERRVWDYQPVPREGLAIAAMDDGQRAAAWATVEAALSVRGATEARAIVDLEPILGAIERAAGWPDMPVRDPERYWFASFGEVGDPSGWAWRLGGHHLALQVVVVDGRVASVTPSFLGANPAVVPNGPTAGSRALTGEETLARALLDGLSPGERQRAIVDPVAPPDIRSGLGARADVRSVPNGIAHDELGPAGRSALERLIRHYLGRAPADVADDAWARVVAPGLAGTTFAWAGSDRPGEGHYYAIRGERLLVEYDNTQNRANHVHALWRDLVDDWGDDTLAAHYRTAHA
jgi:hypothetical protein